MYTAAAAATKSLQSCLTLCNPIDGSPPGSTVPGILQARTLEWVAISFSKFTSNKLHFGKYMSKILDLGDFLGDPVVKNLLFGVVDRALIPGRELRSHMPQGNEAHVPTKGFHMM